MAGRAKAGSSVYAASQEGAFAKNFGLRDQIQRASVSIMLNIAEGFERSGNKEFPHFLYMAKGLAGEVRSRRYIAQETWDIWTRLSSKNYTN